MLKKHGNMKNNLIPNMQKIGNYSFDSSKTTPVSSLYQQQSKSKDKILLTDDYKQVVRNSDGSYRFYGNPTILKKETTKVSEKKEPVLTDRQKSLNQYFINKQKDSPKFNEQPTPKLSQWAINPKNWGVEDLSNLKTRGEAFNTARNKGEKAFIYKGTRYNTNYAGTTEQQLKETGLTNEQLQNRSSLNKNLANNLYPVGYQNAISRTFSAGVMNKKEEKRKYHEEGKFEMPEMIEAKNRRLDALNLYSGIPQKNNTFGISKYIPTDSKDKNKTYYNFNSRDREHLEEKLIDKLSYNPLAYMYTPDGKFSDGTLMSKETLKEMNSMKTINVGERQSDIDNINGMGTMGEYTISTGKDKRGKYISYYDKWDLNPLELSIAGKELPTNFGKPFEIYDRVYVNNYGNNGLKRMFYTDDELSKLNPDKKNFDTLALQRELNNRGYELPKSIRKDKYEDLIRPDYMPNKFDGILGDETKQALLDWQNKNKKMYGGKLLPLLNKF
jgi:hypothetical protein